MGAARVRQALTDTADLLDSLVDQTLELMNAGARLDEVLHTVAAPAHLAERPYLRPVYDEPEFVVRNVWRLYGGWWDGNPASLKPAPESALAGELAALAGGAGVLADRALALVESPGRGRRAERCLCGWRAIWPSWPPWRRRRTRRSTGPAPRCSPGCRRRPPRPWPKGSSPGRPGTPRDGPDTPTEAARANYYSRITVG